MQALEPVHQNDPPPYVWLQSLLPTIAWTSIFGSLISFTIAVGQFGAPRRFWHGELEIFISLAWLFFMCALCLTITVQMAMTFQRHHVVDAFGRGRDGYRKWRDGGSSKAFGERMAVAFVVKVPTGLILVLLILFAFMFLSLCIVGYCLAVGWIGFVVTILMMILSIVVWFMQNHA